MRNAPSPAGIPIARGDGNGKTEARGFIDHHDDDRRRRLLTLGLAGSETPELLRKRVVDGDLDEQRVSG